MIYTTWFNTCSWCAPRTPCPSKCRIEVENAERRLSSYNLQVLPFLCVFTTRPLHSFVHFQCLHTQPNKISVPAKARDTPVHLSSSYKYLVWRQTWEIPHLILQKWRLAKQKNCFHDKTWRHKFIFRTRVRVPGLFSFYKGHAIRFSDWSSV